MKLLAVILSLLSLTGGPVQRAVEALAAKGGALEHSVWGILAVTFDGDTLACLNPGKCMVPASNMKLVTTAGAYLKLGRNYRFTTTLATDGTVQDRSYRTFGHAKGIPTKWAALYFFFIGD